MCVMVACCVLFCWLTSRNFGGRERSKQHTGVNPKQDRESNSDLEKRTPTRPDRELTAVSEQLPHSYSYQYTQYKTVRSTESTSFTMSKFNDGSSILRTNNGSDIGIPTER